MKEEANETFQRMRESNTGCKMIAGDNIFIAIETAVRCEAAGVKGKFIMLEGRRLERVGIGEKNFRAKLLEGSGEIKETMMSEEDFAE